MSRSTIAFSLFELMLLLGCFVKALIKPDDVQDAMSNLDCLSSQELQMVVPNILAAVNHMNLNLTAMRRKPFPR